MLYNGEIILAAHRGDRKCCPENTLPAFASAIDFGADMIETDIHMTRDGQLIILHDRNTKRTTGHDGWSNEMTYEEIRKLDAGAWFGEEFAGTRIPSVEEFIAQIKDTDLRVNWELKDYPREVGDDFAFAAADRLISMIDEHNLRERSMLNSFSDRVLEHIVRHHGHDIPIHGQGIHNCCRSNDTASIPREELYDWCCLYPEEKGKSPLDYRENFDYCLSRGILPCVCISDTYESYQKALEMGCKMFTTNDMRECDQILKQLSVR